MVFEAFGLQIHNGEFDEIRLWNTALSDSIIRSYMNQEINETHPNYENLVSYWNINEGVAGNIINDVVGNNNGTLINMNVTNEEVSTIPVGENSKYVNTQNPTAIGSDGAQLKVTITSEPDEIHNLGIYQSGENNGVNIENESFPENIKFRYNILWGIFEFGRDIKFGEKVIADVEIDYSKIVGIATSDSVRLLKRNNALDAWEDITDIFLHDKDNRKFSLTGGSLFEEEYAIGWGATVVDVKNELPPFQFNLNQNYPNPFNPSTTISFSIPERSFVELVIFNSIGQKVKTLVKKELNAGKYNFKFDGNNFSSGIYFYRLKFGSIIKVKKMILLQ